jgi:Putative amidoligase enzyme
MPATELSDREREIAYDLQHLWRESCEWGREPQRGTDEFVRFVTAVWARAHLYGVDAAQQGIRMCSTCSTPFPDDPRWFYVRPPENSYTRCQVCYRTYQARYNKTVRRMARQLSLASHRRFGLELEFVGNSRSVQRAMRENGLACVIPGYTHEVYSGWKIVPDGSVARGAELVSPILSGRTGCESTILACKALKDGGASTDQSTGLHVHHTVADLDTDEFKKVYAFWFNAQDAIEELVSPSRRLSHWCKKVSQSDLGAIENMEDLHYTGRNVLARRDRYLNLNVQAYLNYQTMEIRWHQGTRDARKIIGWTSLFQSIITYVQMGAELPQPGVKLDELLDRLKSRDVLEDRTVSWLKTRAKQLNPTTDTEMQKRAAVLVRERQRRQAAYNNGYSLGTETDPEPEDDAVGYYEPEYTDGRCRPGICDTCDRARAEAAGETEEY